MSRMSTDSIIGTVNTRVEINVDSQTVSRDETQPKVQLKTFKFILLIIGLLFGVLFAALNQTVLDTALPTIASELKASDEIKWVSAAYLLTSTVFQPAYGKFSDIFGRKIIFMFSVMVFQLGGFLGGRASNMTMLIISRAIAGVGGGGIISLAMVIVSDIVPLQNSGKYQGIIGAIFGFAPVMAPLIGGAFADHVSWKWALYINLPLGAIAGAAILLFPSPKGSGSLLQKLRRVDYAGTIIIVGATIALLLPLNLGGNEYAWSSPIIIALLAVGGVGFLLFALVEAKFAVEPIAPPRLFKNLNLVGCYATNFFQGMASFALVYYIPIYFQAVKGETATNSVLGMIPYVVGIVEASIGIGIFVSRYGFMSYRTLCAIGAVHMTMGTALMILWNERTGKFIQFSYIIMVGLGAGCIIPATLLCALSIVKDKDIAAVTTLLMYFRLIGAVIGIAIVGVIFSNHLSENLAQLSIPPDYIEAVKQSTTIVSQLPEEIRKLVILAYVDSLRASFITIVPLSGLSIISSILMGCHKPKVGKCKEKVSDLE